MTNSATYIVRTDDGYQHELENVYAWEEAGWLAFYADSEQENLVAGFSMMSVTSCCRTDVKSGALRSSALLVMSDEGSMN